MKLEEGMYVRTNDGYICKILKLNEPFEDDGYLDHNDIRSSSIQEKNVVKASHNIIDLIEVGDYVNGYKVLFIDKDLSKIKNIKCIDNSEERQCFYEEDIKSIVTKEQFESMSYKVEVEE